MLSKAMMFSELEAGFARGVREGLHSAVIEVAVAVEHDLVDLALEADLGNEGADLLGCVRLVVVLERALEVARERRGGGERLAVDVVDDLRVDVPAAAEDAEPRALGLAGDFSSNAELAALPADEIGRHGYFDPLALAALPALRRMFSPR